MYEPTRYFLLPAPCDAEVVANVELRRSGFARDHHLENAAIGGTYIVATHQEDHGVIGVGIGRHGILPLAQKNPLSLLANSSTDKRVFLRLRPQAPVRT